MIAEEIIGYYTFGELPCGACPSTVFTIEEGKGPHAAATRCLLCGRFNRWLSKDRISQMRAKDVLTADDVSAIDGITDGPYSTSVALRENGITVWENQLEVPF